MLKISVVNIASWIMIVLLILVIGGIVIKKYIIDKNDSAGNGVSKKLVVFLNDLKNNNKDIEIIYNMFIKSRKKVSRIPGGTLSEGQIILFTNIVNFNKDLQIDKAGDAIKVNGKKFKDIDLDSLYKFRNKLIKKLSISAESVKIIVLNKGRGNIVDSRLSVMSPSEVLSTDLLSGNGGVNIKKAKKFIEDENIVKIKNTTENIRKELKGK